MKDKLTKAVQAFKAFTVYSATDAAAAGAK
jgi:hypothetical protein